MEIPNRQLMACLTTSRLSLSMGPVSSKVIGSGDVLCLPLMDTFPGPAWFWPKLLELGGLLVTFLADGARDEDGRALGTRDASPRPLWIFPGPKDWLRPRSLGMRES